MAQRPGLRALVLVLRTVLAAAVLAFAVAVVLRGGDREQVPLVDIGLYCGVYLVGGVLLLLQGSTDRSERWAWRALGLGLFATMGGDVYYSLRLSHLEEPPYPSTADLLWLLWYPAAYAAVILLIRSRVRHFHPSLVLDGLVAGLGAAAVTAAFVVENLVEATGGSPAAVLVNLAYPVADLLLLLVLVAGGAVVGSRVTGPTVAVVVGLLLMACADVLYLLAEAAGTYTEGGPTDLLWLLGVLALVAAPTMRRAGRPDTGAGPGRSDATAAADASTGGRRLDRQLVALPLAAGVVSLAFIGRGQLSPVPGTALLLADACVLVALGRGWLTLRELRRREEVELEHAHHQARTDELTGLANRRALMEHCDEVVRRATTRDPASVLLLDLDRFKEINDSLGHAGGDELLRQVAQRVASALPPGDLVARLGGDEFAVVLPRTDTDAALSAARSVRAALVGPFLVDGIRLHVAASIGVASAPDPAASRSELMRLADIAMYEAKRGNGGVAAAGPQTCEATPDRLRTVDELRSALAQDDMGRAGSLVVHLQPQVRLAGASHHGLDPAATDVIGGEDFDTVVGVEALVRWDHPVRGLLLPGAFLPLAESAGLSGELARRVLDLSLTACRQWWVLGHEVPVAVNLSAADLTARVPELVAEALDRHRLPGRALVVELTETTMMADPRAAGLLLQRIRELGVAVSIDDYGTGYSSLAYLRDLSADELKLDRAFTAEMLTNEATASIVRTTVDLAHSLGLRLVAEGIEDAACARALAAFGCDVGQGHHIARPMPAAEMQQWLVARAAGPGAALERREPALPG